MNIDRTRPDVAGPPVSLDGRVLWPAEPYRG